jgi:hypothetical protein
MDLRGVFPQASGPTVVGSLLMLTRSFVSYVQAG